MIGRPVYPSYQSCIFNCPVHSDLSAPVNIREEITLIIRCSPVHGSRLQGDRLRLVLYCKRYEISVRSLINHRNGERSGCWVHGNQYRYGLSWRRWRLMPCGLTHGPCTLLKWVVRPDTIRPVRWDRLSVLFQIRDGSIHSCWLELSDKWASLNYFFMEFRDQMIWAFFLTLYDLPVPVFVHWTKTLLKWDCRFPA